MPRPNPPRTLHSETNLARRIAHERERRGWTYEGTAKRLTDAGCPIQPSAIYKIEKGATPRRISVDELVALAEVFGIPVEKLLLPVEVVESAALLDLLVEWEVTRRAADSAREAAETALEAVRRYAQEREDMEPTLHRFVRNWVESWSTKTEFDEAYWMFKLTDSESWKHRAKATFDALVDDETRSEPDRG